MDTAAPAEAANDAGIGLINKLNAFIAAAKSAAADGLTWSEFAELAVSLLRLSVAGLDRVSELTGPQKKELAVRWVGHLFDAVADKAVPLAAYPIWILVRPAVRSLVLAFAAGAIEQILPLVRKAG